ncbi:MAG: 1-phosphofructokinase family hexose kinase [Rhodomicrobium sp.]
MAHILTITMNPAIDIATSVERVHPARKLRCAEARRYPGGGGINVARVMGRLGSEATALYPVGGYCGQLFQKLVDQENIRKLAIPIEEATREDFTVVETSTGNEFRFVSKGPHLREADWRRCLETFAGFRDPIDLLVAGGSLPPGVPEDFYAWIAEIARGRGVPFALDTSGAALRAALEQGVHLVKPNLREMRELMGEPLANLTSCIEACKRLVASAKANLVALTLGSQGAVLVTKNGAWFAPPLLIKAISTVGTGDSFLGAMVCGLACGLSEQEAFRQGVAAGSAALLAPGTELCQSADVQDLLKHVVIKPLA